MNITGFLSKTQEPYETLLLRREWQRKRLHILNRDNHTCQNCFCDETYRPLHVHHKHYIIGCDPWEYKDSELVTLCEECHDQVHSTEIVPIFRLVNGELIQTALTPCRRCGGRGHFKEYRHVQHGICFRCHGQRYEEYITVCEDYSREKNIELPENNNGFRPVKEESKRNIVSIEIKEGYKDPNKRIVKVSMKSGQIISLFLDFSVEAEEGDRLDIESFMIKERKFKNGIPYLVGKGRVIK